MADHDTLAAALAAFQADLPTIDKGQTAKIKSDKGSYSYQYADLADVSAEVLPLLAAQGLSFTASPTFDGDRFVLAYALLHTSGQSREGTYPLPTAQPQQVGSAITYARRYCLCAVTGVAPDEDDDGQAAQQAQPASKGKAPSKPSGNGGGPVCSRCGSGLAGAKATKVDGQFVHKDGCPEPDETATSEADRSGGDDGSEQASTSSPPDTSWRGVMEAAGVDERELLVRLNQRWPSNSQWSRPVHSGADMDRAAAEEPDLVQRCIGELEDERKAKA